MEAVRSHPDRDLLIARDGTFTYAEVGERAATCAMRLSRLGLRKADRVALVVDNRPEFFMVWLGLMLQGGVLVALNPSSTDRELAKCIAHSAPKFVVADGDSVERIWGLVQGIDSVQELIALEDLVDSSQQGGVPLHSGIDVKADLFGDDPISLVYTSGTTGHPKAVVQTHANYVLTGQAYPYWLGMEDGDRIYACLPVSHIGPQAYSLMGALTIGGTVVVAPKFSATMFWKDVAEFRVSAVNIVGAMAIILLEQGPVVDERRHALKVLYTVPALTGDRRTEAEDRFGVQVISGFGMSENTFGLMEGLRGAKRPGSMGFPRQHPETVVPRTRAKVIGEDGQDLGVQEVGELAISSAAMMKGYFGADIESSETMCGEWLCTGDLVYRDNEGYFYFVERRKEIIRYRGENVSPSEVEGVISEFPGVVDVAVVGIPSPFTDEEIVASIVVRPGHQLDHDGLLYVLRSQLGRYKIPRFIRLVEELPRTKSEKVDKDSLRKRARREREQGSLIQLVVDERERRDD